MDSLFSVLIFMVLEVLFENIFVFVCLDWDLNIIDVFGGCVIEINVYWRILLIWLGKVGFYNYYVINVYCVWIMDFFFYYYLKEGGFDEFYLV